MPATSMWRAAARPGYWDLLISDDSGLLGRIATHILAFEGDSHALWFEGNYQDYEKDYKRRKGADADQPHRIKYRRIDA